MNIELKQSLTDPENQPNQFGVEFLMHGEKFAFKVGCQQFTLDYEPSEVGDFEFMRDMLIGAFSTFTHDVKTACAAIQQPATAIACGIPGMTKTTCPYCEQGFAFEHEQPDTGEPVGFTYQAEIDYANSTGGNGSFWRVPPDLDDEAVPLYDHPAPSVPDDVVLDCYDAGILNDFGGGNVEWWQDYIRAELGHAHDFYQSQIDAAMLAAKDTK